MKIAARPGEKALCNPLFDRSTCDDLGDRVDGCMAGMKLSSSWKRGAYSRGLCLCPKCYKQKKICRGRKWIIMVLADANKNLRIPDLNTCQYMKRFNLY